MIRLVLGEDGALVVDLTARAFGRGAWVHPRPDCLAQAARGGAAKSFRSKVATDVPALFAAVRAAAHRRVAALLSSARGAGRLACGSDAAAGAFHKGDAALVLVAGDARAAAGASWVTGAAAAGKAVQWGTKEELGRATSRPDTGVVAVQDRGLAHAIARAVALSSLPEPGERQTGLEAVMEVR